MRQWSRVLKSVVKRLMQQMTRSYELSGVYDFHWASGDMIVTFDTSTKEWRDLRTDTARFGWLNLWPDQLPKCNLQSSPALGVGLRSLCGINMPRETVNREYFTTWRCNYRSYSLSRPVQPNNTHRYPTKWYMYAESLYKLACAASV